MAQNRKQLLEIYNNSSEEIKNYFGHFPELIKDVFPYEISIGYLYSKIEAAHKMALYIGIVNRYLLNGPTTKKTVIDERINRPRFKIFFHKIFEQEIRGDILYRLEQADKVRNSILHGGSYSDDDVRHALSHILEYTKLFNEFVDGIKGFKPIGGDLRGVINTRSDRATETASLLALKGMGFKSI